MTDACILSSLRLVTVPRGTTVKTELAAGHWLIRVSDPLLCSPGEGQPGDAALPLNPANDLVVYVVTTEVLSLRATAGAPLTSTAYFLRVP